LNCFQSQQKTFKSVDDAGLATVTLDTSEVDWISIHENSRPWGTAEDNFLERPIHVALDSSNNDDAVTTWATSVLVESDTNWILCDETSLPHDDDEFVDHIPMVAQIRVWKEAEEEEVDDGGVTVDSHLDLMTAEQRTDAVKDEKRVSWAVPLAEEMAPVSWHTEVNSNDLMDSDSDSWAYALYPVAPVYIVGLGWL